MRLNGTLGMLALGALAAVAALAGWQQSRQGDATVAQLAAREALKPFVAALPAPGPAAAPFPSRDAGQPAALASASTPAASGLEGSIAPVSSGSGTNYAASPFRDASVATLSIVFPEPLRDVGAAGIAAGTVPTGRLGTPGPAAGAAPLGVEPTGSGSMPNLPAPVGVMASSPPPTGKLGE